LDLLACPDISLPRERVFLLLLGAAEIANHHGPLPDDPAAFGYAAAASFLVFTALAAICDLTRRPR